LSSAVLVASSMRAEDEQARKAREEVERQLKQMVGTPPTRVRVDFDALDEVNYALEQASFELDGKRLTSPSVSELSREGHHLVWIGDVSPGRHVVRANVTYFNQASVVVSDEGGHRWKVGGDVAFEVNAGIEVQVRVVPSRDPTQRQISRRLRLNLPARPVMVAALDDGKMPEPAPAPPAEVEARPTVEEAEARESPPLGVRQRKTAAGGMEKPRFSSRDKLAANSAPLDAGSGTGVALGATEVARLPEILPDAGVTHLTAAPAPVRVASRPMAPEEELPGWMVLAGIGGSVAAVLVILLVARRRGGPRVDR
jgi:hypothetical protein